MNRILPISALVLALVALGAALLRSPQPEDASARVSTETSDGPEVAPLDLAERDEKIAALESTVASLVRRIAQLEKAKGAEPGEAVAVGSRERQQLEALRGDVDALLTGEAVDTEKGRQRLKEVVHSIQDELFAERIQEREAARESARTERLTKLVQEARLSATQESDLKALIEQETQQRTALREQRRSGKPGDGRQARAEIRALRERTDEGARAFLDDEQFAKYQKMRKADRRVIVDGGPERGNRRGQ